MLGYRECATRRAVLTDGCLSFGRIQLGVQALGKCRRVEFREQRSRLPPRGGLHLKRGKLRKGTEARTSAVEQSEVHSGTHQTSQRPRNVSARG